MRATGRDVFCLCIMGVCIGFALAMSLVSGGVGLMNPAVIAVFGMVFIGTVAFWLGGPPS
jgi:hypothetical protein